MTTRNTAGQFVKGQSGNPSGKPKAVKVIIDQNGTSLPVDQIFELNGNIVLGQLMKTIMDPKTPPASRVASIKIYMEYWLGKPNAKLVITPTEEGDEEAVFTVENLSQDDLKKLYDNAKPKGGS